MTTMHLRALAATVVAGFAIAAASTASAQSSPPSSSETSEASEDATGASPSADRAARSSTDEPSTGPPDALSLFATSNTDGKLASPRCRRTPVVEDESLAYANQVEAYRSLRRRSRNTRGTDPLAFHLGDSSFPGPIGRFLLAKRPEGGRTLASILHRIPYTAHVLGNQELGLPQGALNNFVRGARRETLPLQAANVVCDDGGGGEIVCETLGTGPPDGPQAPYRIVERRGLRIGVVSILDPTVRNIIAPSRLAGFDVLAPTPVLERQVSRMQTEGEADLVVVLYHATQRTSMGDTVDLTERVEGIDLVVTNQGLERQASEREARPEDYRYLLTPDERTYILASGYGATRATAATLHLANPSRSSVADWQIDEIETRFLDRSDTRLDETTADLLRRTARNLCREWGEPLARKRPLAEAFDRTDFVQFVLNTMRFTTRAEVALANEGAFLNSDHFPLEDYFTLADIYTILPFNNDLVTVGMSGEQLAALEEKIGSDIVAVGLERSKDGEDVLVNGRPLNDKRTYRVATNRFTAEGSDNLLDPSALAYTRVYRADWTREPPAISEVIVHQLERGRFTRRRGSTLSPSEIFPDLHRRLLWSLRGSLTTSYDQVTSRNPMRNGQPAYNQPKLTVQSTDQIDVEAQVDLSADSRNHGWDSSLQAHYATARIENNGGGEFEETKDQLRGKTRYKYAGWRANVGGAWWMPMPTVELQAETEFDPPAEREWRQLEFTGIAGFTFELFEPFEIKIGADVRRDVNEPAGRTTYGLATAYQWTRTDLADWLGSPVKFESEVEYFFNDFRNQRLHEFRNSNRLYYAVFDQLHFTTTFTSFLFRSADVGEFGVNTELTVGLNYLWTTSIQSF